MTFYQWAMTKRFTNTPMGDFLAYMRDDRTTVEIENTRAGWECHLAIIAAGERARIAFRALWVIYCNRCGDPQQVKVIAERQANLFLKKELNQ